MNLDHYMIDEPGEFPDADLLSRRERVLRALRCVYGDATPSEGGALWDALEDEGVL